MTRERLAWVLGVVSGMGIVLAPKGALACGGFFAQGVEVSPEQKIVVEHRDGVETYVFRPHFCGAAKDFGVILPIPAPLSSSPVLADNALFDQLDSYTAPEIVEVCRPTSTGCGAGAKNDEVGRGADAGSGVIEVSRGRVGVFDYVLLQATTASAFTDWLDQNGFPHAATASDAYDYYVSKHWYFVAFKVSADTNAPPAGTKLCGDLGPIALSFAAAQPVVPVRIAGVNVIADHPPVWQIFLIAGSPQRLPGTSTFRSTLYFFSPLRPSELSAYPALSARSREGESLTVLKVTFPWSGASSDIDFEADNPRAEVFRSKTTVEKECHDGCAAGGTAPVSVVGVAVMLSTLLGFRRSVKRARAGR